MSKFFQDIKTAVTGENFVSTFSERGLGTAIWYHYRVALIVAVVFTLSAALFIVPALLKFSVADFVSEYYPDNLVVTIEDGAVSTNVDEPYAVPLDGKDPYTVTDTNSRVPDTKKSPAHALVIDTRTIEPLTAMDTYDTYALLTKNQILVRDDGEIRVFKLTDITFTISESEILSVALMLRPVVFVFIVIFTILFPFLIAAGSLVGSLFVALLFALIVLLIGRVHDLALSYKKAYVLTLYLLTLPLMFTLLDNFIPYESWVRLVIFIALAVAFIRPVHTDGEIEPKPDAAQPIPEPSTPTSST